MLAQGSVSAFRASTGSLIWRHSAADLSAAAREMSEEVANAFDARALVAGGPSGTLVLVGVDEGRLVQMELDTRTGKARASGKGKNNGKAGGTSSCLHNQHYRLQRLLMGWPPP